MLNIINSTEYSYRGVNNKARKMFIVSRLPHFETQFKVNSVHESNNTIVFNCDAVNEKNIDVIVKIR